MAEEEMTLLDKLGDPESAMEGLSNDPLEEKPRTGALTENQIEDLASNFVRYAQQYPWHQIRYAPGVTQDFAKAPHGIIAGNTGSGKSYFTYYMIMWLKALGNTIWGVDPKNAELLQLGMYLPKNRILSADDPNKVTDWMNSRVIAMSKANREQMEEAYSKKLLGVDFTDFKKPMNMIFVEELAALGDSFETTKEKATFMNKMSQIAMKGRSSGYNLINILQSPRAESLPKKINNQMNFRLILNGGSKTERDSLFGTRVDLLESFQRKQGVGLYSLEGTEATVDSPKKLEVPFLFKDKNTLARVMFKILEHELPLNATPTRQ